MRLLFLGALWINRYETWREILLVPGRLKVCHLLRKIHSSAALLTQSLVHPRSNIYATETSFKRTDLWYLGFASCLILGIWGWEARRDNQVDDLIIIFPFAIKHFVLIFFVKLRVKLLILLIEQYFTALHFLDHLSVFHLILKSLLSVNFLKVLGQIALFTL